MTDIDHNPVSEEQYAIPKVITKKGFSPVWILPIVALLIGLGLIVKSYLNAGIIVTLQVPTADGIAIGKTRVLFKGIAAGVVKERDITDDLQHVILSIEMDKRTEPFLNQKTQFWIVEPRISLSGISGLDTILGGRYIAISAEKGSKSKRKFIALNTPPPPSQETPGLHIKLRLNRLASVDQGTVIYYKQIPVGEVTHYTLEENDSEIQAWVLIKPEYAHLVKKNSLFYNVSGIKIDAGLSGIKIKTESLISVLAGGIAFHTPLLDEEKINAPNGPDKANKSNTSIVEHGSIYLLYDDFESANVGIPIVLLFKNVRNLQENITVIKFQGRKIGTLGKFSYDKTSNETVVVAHIDPLMEDALRDNTQFWIVKPSLILLEISGLDALIQGNYISMRPSIGGELTRKFKVSESIPSLSKSVPGLHFYIETETLSSMKKGVPIFYKQIPVGNIEGFELTKDTEKVRLSAFIKPEFAHLVKKNSRFYNVSGLNIQAGLSGIKVKTESLMSLITGGVSFYTPETFTEQEHQAVVEQSKNDDVFKLYDDFDDAKAGYEVSLIFATAAGLSAGSTKVIYKGLVLGVVKKITPDKGKQTVTASITFDPIAENSLVEDTKFWMVRPQISLSGVKNIETLLGGDYITLRSGESKKKQLTFNVSQHRPPFNHTFPGLHLKLNSTELGAVAMGSPILYQRIKIGDVQNYELAEDRISVNILIHILPQYKDLVTSVSRFYNASGIRINANLSGVDIRTESFESILAGGIALYNMPDQKHKSDTRQQKKVRNGAVFDLFNDYDAARTNAFYVNVRFSDPQGLSIGSKVKYKGVSVGEVESISLDKKNSDLVWVKLELNSVLKAVLGKKSLFWVSKAHIGLTRTDNIDTLISGNYINVLPVKTVKGKSTVPPEAINFTALDEELLISQSRFGFTVNLTASRLSSVRTGDPVYYHQVVVGKVIGYEIADTADQILIYLSIRNRFKPLIRENSKFWHASGVSMDIRLFGTSKIRTESLEAIIAGGISFATPDNDKMGDMLASGSFFVLHDEPKEQWTQWNPIIHLSKEMQQD